jgi:hypothetical protein
VRRLLFAALIVTIAAGGCIKPRPKTGPQTAAPLDVPPAPPRVIALPDPEEPPESAAPTEPEPAGKDKPRGTRPRPPAARAPQPDTAKPPEAKPDTPPVVIEAPKPAAPVQPPLQPALQASTQELTKQVEAQLAQAGNDLKKVDQRTLSADGKTQYQAAQQFIAQARTALREGNLVFAQKLSEKAVGLASNLAPR